MNILFVINNLYTKGNGLSGSARRTIQYLRKTGVAVKTLSAANPEPQGEQPDFVLPDDTIPLFHGIIQRQGYAFAKPDAEIIARALQWADVVHLEEPFALQWKVVELAERVGVPCVATYHLHPENFFASVHLMWCRYLNNATMRVWKKKVFRHCAIVQCPTQNVKDRLERTGLQTELRVISNGLIPDGRTEGYDTAPEPSSRFRLLCVGRYSNEKDQVTLLNAMRYCAHADQIHLVFAGRGPIEKKLRRKARQLVRDGFLKIEPSFGFFSYDELMHLAHSSTLYIHCAIIEVEGLSCLEVIKEGVVPVIAAGPYTATTQFALNEKSVYPARDAKALAERIDYWLEHPAQREETARQYVSIGKEYDIRRSVGALVKMYEDANNRHQSSGIKN